ncbi:MAG: 1-acyl-sn-glycerol-3-phosphate acyltransferase [Deltaproteobacteria bacterium HGW-Deltaproteobacteria-17]|nr:MAG: 1-acyl-sn-glycerol-3-phosphate acyltransferase [Deltaproteobacteria bacterium HGW-Deltaproteobacteria-17]
MERMVDKSLPSAEVLWKHVENLLEIPRHARQWMKFVVTTLHYGMVDPYNPLSAGPNAALPGWSCRVLEILGIQVSATGLEHVHHHRSQVFFVNHQSNIDVLILGATVPVPIFWLYKHTLDKMPVLGRALRRQGNISIIRHDRPSAMQSIEQAAQMVRDGKNLLVFPEGTRSGRPRMGPFKKGVFHLALAAGAPIVPVSIAHSWKIMPRGSLKLNPVSVQVRFHPAIDTTAYDTQTMPELMERVRAALASGLQRDGDSQDEA